jgi:hypothetical protein
MGLQNSQNELSENMIIVTFWYDYNLILLLLVNLIKERLNVSENSNDHFFRLQM